MENSPYIYTMDELEGLIAEWKWKSSIISHLRSLFPSTPDKVWGKLI